MFRKEIGKWKIILWPVLISIAASSLVMVQRSSQFATVATVNGRAISSRQYSEHVASLRERINQMRAYARSSGLPVETFMQLSGLGDPAQAALDMCIHEKLVEGALAPAGIVLHPEVVSDELLKTLQPFVNADGTLNETAYHQYLKQQHLYVSHFEDKKEQEMKANLFNDFVRNGGYQPAYVRKDDRQRDYQRKSFGALVVSYDKALRAMKRTDLSDDEKKQYFEANREKYRVPEKRSAEYWVLRPSSFEDSVEISDEAIERFYNKNKSKLYRIPTKVKVRHIYIAEADDGFERANDAYVRVLDKPELFAEVAKEVSENSDTAYHGGERDFFSRGTYGKDFETAAFRLKEANEIAPLTKVEGGYEIIQLVERIPAREKDLADVRDEVMTAVRGKRSLEWLRSNLEQLRRHASSKKETLERLVSRAESHDSMRDAEQAKGNSYSKEGNIISHLYQLREKGDFTFFMHEDAYYLVQLSERTSSFIPSLEKVNDRVEEDMYAGKAQIEVARIATRVHQALVEGKERSEVADEYKADEKETDLLSVKDANADFFNGMHGGLRKAFSLSSKAQVLRQSKGSDVYLIQLIESKLDASDDEDGGLEDESSDELRKALDEHGQQVSRAFIASLRRSATLELNEKMLANQAR
ncbi:MAG: SurA N-terminal domain-containing protein [Candidatus Dependentiae bacterium]|jgi:peptidyl-prolyl cis-trans isomerase D